MDTCMFLRYPDRMLGMKCHVQACYKMGEIVLSATTKTTIFQVTLFLKANVNTGVKDVGFKMFLRTCNLLHSLSVSIALFYCVRL